MPTVIYRLFIYTIFINTPKWDKSYFSKNILRKSFFYLRNSMYISDNNKVTITE